MLLEKILVNPVREESNVDAAGEIAYQGDSPVTFQAAIIRKLYFGSHEFYGVVGSTLCSKPCTSPVLLMQLMKVTIKPRGGGVLFFARRLMIIYVMHCPRRHHAVGFGSLTMEIDVSKCLISQL